MPRAGEPPLAIFAVLIAADLVFTRGTGGVGLRGAAVLSGLWIAAGLAFGGALWLWQGSDVAGQYFGGYLLEKALSVNNILVFVLLFASLAVPVPLQRRVLYLGVVGTLVLRGGLIAAGGALIDHVDLPEPQARTSTARSSSASRSPLSPHTCPYGSCCAPSRPAPLPRSPSTASPGGPQRHPLRHMTQGKHLTATAVPGSGPGTKGRHGFARIRVGAAAGTGVSGRPGWRGAPGCGTASRGGERTASEQHEPLPGLHFRDVWPGR